MRASSKSTKCGPAPPTGRCRRGSRRAGDVCTSPARSKQRMTPSSAERDDALPRVREIGRNEAVREQPVARLLAEGLDVERRPLDKRRDRADAMNAPEEAAHPFQRRGSSSSGARPPRRGRPRSGIPRIVAASAGPRCERGDDGYFARRARTRRRAPRGSARRSSAAGGRTWRRPRRHPRDGRPRARGPRARPGRRGFRSC